MSIQVSIADCCDEPPTWSLSPAQRASAFAGVLALHRAALEPCSETESPSLAALPEDVLRLIRAHLARAYLGLNGCAAHGLVDVVELFCERTCAEGLESAAETACGVGQAKVVLALLRQGVRVALDLLDDLGCETGDAGIIGAMLENGSDPAHVATIASGYGHLGLLQQLCRRGLPPGTDRAPLVAACGSGHLDVVRYLVEAHGMAVDGVELEEAASSGHADVVQYLCRAGAPATVTAMVASAIGGSVKVFKTLWSHGLYGQLEGEDDGMIREMVKCASEGGHLDLLEHMASLGLSTMHDAGALIAASENGHTSVVVFLVGHGASPTSRESCALRYASAAGFSDVVDVLLRSGARADDRAGEALRIASSNGHLAVVNSLLDAGADVHCYGDAPIRQASQFGHMDIVKILASHGADIHAGHDLPLRSASAAGNLEVVQFLLAHNADVSGEEDLAIRLASGGGHLDVVKALVDAGADVRSDDDGAIRAASNSGHLSVVRYLVGLVPEAKEELRDAAVSDAIIEGRLEVLEWLVGAGAQLGDYQWAVDIARRAGHDTVVEYITTICQR